MVLHVKLCIFNHTSCSLPTKKFSLKCWILFCAAPSGDKGHNVQLMMGRELVEMRRKHFQIWGCTNSWKHYFDALDPWLFVLFSDGCTVAELSVLSYMGFLLGPVLCLHCDIPTLVPFCTVWVPACCSDLCTGAAARARVSSLEFNLLEHQSQGKPLSLLWILPSTINRSQFWNRSQVYLGGSPTVVGFPFNVL